MKQFWTTVLGSFVGMWIGLILFSVFSVIASFVFIGVIASMQGETKVAVENNSILHINLSGTISERNNPEDVFASIFSEGQGGLSLEALLKSIAVAKDDDKIKGIYIECNGASAGSATLYELRNAINDFKKSKKFVYAYGNEGISQSDYYVASVSDSIFLNPIGAVDIHGLSATNSFYKKALDKVGVEMQVIRVGTFKSAVEPYMLTEMSAANRMQQEHYMGNIWKNISGSMATSRKMTPVKVNELADSILITQSANYLLANKVVDRLCYRYEFDNRLKKLTDVGDKDDLRLVEPNDLMKVASKSKSDKKIAIIYAEGEIDGNSEDGIDSKSLVEDILAVSKDDNIKGVVLRVNSPGGSAFGSEQIWAALEQVKKSKKPFAVSMGDLAASGGYYISCGADRIFAEPVTITGSIGIFGVIPCFQNLLEDKIGITQSVVNTNANGNFISVTQKMTPIQQASMQKMINNGYELFTSRCATGRHMSQDSLKSIAEGRVWDGVSAMSIGLIDEYGNLESALKWVSAKAKLADYTVSTYPEQKDMFEKYLSKYMKTKMNDMVKSETGELYQYHDVISKILGRSRIMCLMEPVEIK